MIPTVVSVPEAHHRRIDDAVRSTLRHARACSHVTAGRPGFICIIHPGLIRCHGCAMAHVGTHTEAEEHTCDVCHGPIDADGFEMHTAILKPVATNVTVNRGRGCRTKVRVVLAVGWGTCWPCHVDLSARTWGLS